MKIYIAGPMTGYPDWNFPAFFETEEILKGLGYEVINPAHNDGKTLEEALLRAGRADAPNYTWNYYMRRDLLHVLDVDCICVLEGWRNSKGASLEVHVAEALDLPIYILKDGKLKPRIEVLGISGWARSGKDTAANYLVENYGYKKFSFAKPMKEAVYNLNPKITINEVQSTPLRVGVDVYDWEGLKERSPDVRVLLQRMGTEVGRNMFGDDFWVDQALDSIPDGTKAVIADVRYPNEADAIRKLGGKIVRIERYGITPPNDHPSETALNDYEFDLTISNDGSIEGLQQILDSNIKKLEATDGNIIP